MPKNSIIVLRGDSAKNNTVISNRFAGQRFVKPGTKIALRGVQAKFTDTAEQFDIAATDTLTIDGNSNAIAAGTYDSFDDVRQLFNEQINNNSGIGINEEVGVGYDIETTGAQVNITKNKHLLTDPDFSDINQWSQLEGTGFIGAVGGWTQTVGTDSQQLLKAGIPRAHNQVDGSLSFGAGEEWSLTAFDGGDELYEFGVNDTGDWFITANGAGTTTSTYSSQIGDSFSFRKYGNKVRLQVSNGGVSQVDETLTYTPLSNNGETWLLFNNPLVNDVQVTNVRMHIFGENQSNTKLTVAFATTRLARYFGFSDRTVSDTGNPAVCQSPDRAKGDLQYAGILVGLPDLPLESDLGSNGVPDTISYLDSIPIDISTLHDVQYTPNVPLPLDLKNDGTEIEINRKLRVVFQKNGEGASGRLQFQGTPVVILEIIEP